MKFSIRFLTTILGGFFFLQAGVFSAPPAAGSGPRFQVTGKWDYSLLAGPEEHKSTLWTQEPAATASWLPGFDGSVRVRVFLHKVAHKTGNDPRVRIEVVHGGKVDEKFLDFSEGVSGWMELGVYDFAGEPGERVRLSRVSGLGTTRASAVRFDVLGEGENPAVIQTFTIDDLLIAESERSHSQPDIVLPPGHEARTGPPDADAWAVSFQDDFKGDHLDANLWAVEAGSPGHILSSRWPENVQVKDGILRLLTRKESRGGKQWTSGNIWSRVFQQKYGYFEARIKIARAGGLNNAFWLMPDKKAGAPGRFEIDIVEAHYPNRLHLTMHNWSGEHTAKSRLAAVSADIGASFHVYGLEWNDKELIWYFDGISVFRLPNDICHGETPVRLSSAVGRFAGRITDALDGTSMEVDWVRVYQRKNP